MKHASLTVVIISSILIISSVGALLPFGINHVIKSVNDTKGSVNPEYDSLGNVSQMGSVSFSFNGLPSNSTISLNVDGLSAVTNTGKLKMTLPYGNYSYAAMNTKGYVSPNWTGTFNLHSTDLIIPVNYTGIPFQSAGLALNNGSQFSIYSSADSNNATPLDSVYDSLNGLTYTISSFPQGFYITGNSSVTFIKTLGEPEDITLMKTTGNLAIAENSSVFVYSPKGTEINSINVPYQTNAIIYDNFSNTLWLGTDSGIYVLNATTLSTLHEIAGINIQIPGQLALDRDNGSVFALNVSSNFSQNSLIIISGNYKIIAEYSLGSFAGEIAFYPEFNRVYVSTVSQEQNTLYYLENGTLKPVYGTGKSYSIGYLGDLNSVYYINQAGSIYLVNPLNSTLVKLMNSSSIPNILINGVNGTFSLISTLNGVVTYTGLGGKVYNLTFIEKGLSGGTAWSVTLNNFTEKSSNRYVTFYETRGSYTVNLNTTSLYSYNKSISVKLSGPENVSLTFKKLYSVVLNSVGMPSGSYLKISIGNTQVNTSLNHYTIYLVNGTYKYSASTSDGFFITPNNGTIVVNGYNRTVNLTWSKVTYSVSINEVGLPAGTPWSIYISGIKYSTDMSQISLNLSNGTYTFSLGLVPGYFSEHYSPEFNISGGNVYIPLKFQETKFNLSFEILNYSGKFPLVFQIGSAVIYENTTNFSEMVPNGSYMYSIIFPGNVWKNISGIAHISDSNLKIILNAKEQFYYLSVQEIGLPPGSEWGFNLSGISVSGNSSTLSERVTNGTYTLYPVMIGGYEPIIPLAITIDGSNETAIVEYDPLPVLYNVTFIQIGLPPGISLQLTVGKVTLSSSGISPAEFYLANGTYNVTVNYTFPPGPPLPPLQFHHVPSGPIHVGVQQTYSQTLQFSVNGTNEFVFLLFVQGQIVLSFTVPVLPPPFPHGPGPFPGPTGPNQFPGNGPVVWTVGRH